MKHPIRSYSPSTPVAGFSLVEVIIASTIMTVILLGVTSATYKQSQALSAQAQRAFVESRTTQFVARLESELRVAQGFTPTAWLVGGIGSGTGGTIRVDTTLGFPDEGRLLIDRGTAWVEVIAYEEFDDSPASFWNLGRGTQCTTDLAHADGTQVYWASMAEAIEDQVSPSPDQYDGIASELSGPVYFRGDGTGFSFKVPTDPSGGTDFLSDGEVQWGAMISGQPVLGGHSCLRFEPVAVVTEAGRSTDLNGDGDEDDTFDLGRIRWRSWDPADPDLPSSEFGLGPTVILQERCNWGGDLDNDGFSDPIFLWMPATNQLHIRMRIIAGRLNNITTTRVIDSLLYLRNRTE